MEQETISVNKIIASNIKIFETSGEIIVPDIKPDIISIINTNANSYIYKEELLDGKIRVDGNIDAFVIYLAENGETRTIQTTLTFAETIEDKDIKQNGLSKCKVFIESIDAKVLNERKLSINANLKLKCDVYENFTINIKNKFDTLNDIEMLKENIEIKSIVGINKVKTSIKEDIKVDNSFEVAEILKTSIEVCNFENKISINKVLAKADANIKVIFLAEDGRISMAKTTIPIMSFIDIEHIVDSNICSIDYMIRNMLFKVNSKESHSISCQVDFEVFCKVFENKNIEIIQDMFGMKKNIEFTKKEVEVETASKSIEEVTSVNERVLVEDVLNILDVDLSCRIVDSSKAGNIYNYECEMDLVFFYESDNKNGINVKHKIIPFIAKSEIESKEKIEFIVDKKEFKVSDENVDLSVDLKLKQTNSDMKVISIIENIEEKNLDEEEDYKMFLYFVKTNDTLWKIAKNFRVPVDNILSINNLEQNSKIAAGDALYIMR